MSVKPVEPALLLVAGQRAEIMIHGRPRATLIVSESALEILPHGGGFVSSRALVIGDAGTAGRSLRLVWVAAPGERT